jgi:hypothetical protein
MKGKIKKYITMKLQKKMENLRTLNISHRFGARPNLYFKLMYKEDDKDG